MVIFHSYVGLPEGNIMGHHLVFIFTPQDIKKSYLAFAPGQ